MPFYEYQCRDCGHELEALQKISDDPLIFCPECNAQSLKKKISAAGFQLKGTGWYETDFKNSGAKPKAESANKTASNVNANSAKSTTKANKSDKAA